MQNFIILEYIKLSKNAGIKNQKAIEEFLLDKHKRKQSLQKMFRKYDR